MSAVDDRERTWSLIHDLLPDGWRVGPPGFDPATRLWEIVARSPSKGSRRAPPPDYVIGTGSDELEALRHLARRLETRISGR